MGRIGVQYTLVHKFFDIMNQCHHCDFEGLYSHFACSDMESDQNIIQKNNFNEAIETFKQAGFTFPLIHLANSGGIFFHPDAHYSMVRAGMVLYGYFEGRTLPETAQLKPVMTWKTEAVIRTLKSPAHPVHISVTAVAKENHTISYYVIVISDLTEQKRAEDDLRYLANYDPLTGLPNRSLMYTKISNCINNAKKYNKLAALLFIDLDKFKLITYQNLDIDERNVLTLLYQPLLGCDAFTLYSTL